MQRVRNQRKNSGVSVNMGTSIRNPRKVFDENGKRIYEKPMRMCIVCRGRQEKHNLVRIVKNKENDIVLDVKGNMQGRGAYICESEKCVDTAKNKKHLNRAFKCAVDDKIFDEISELKRRRT